MILSTFDLRNSSLRNTLYKSIIRPFLFLFDPESIHYFSTNFLKILLKVPGLKLLFKTSFVVKDTRLQTNVFGLTFKNPVGLAAGFDKDARYIDQLSCLGFGFIEIGTLTPKAQEGNQRKRLFRLSEDQGLINRMGFNNNGVFEAVERLKKVNANLLIGGNIGKNKITPNKEAVADYEICFNALYDYVDYFVLNVSSPNTPNLRELQEKKPLKALLLRMKELNTLRPKQKPILLKIAPDLNRLQLDDIISIVLETAIDGVIACNTTISREGLKTIPTALEKIGAGGVSGVPVRDRSTEVIKYISKKSKGVIPIVAVGGVFTGADAAEKLKAGASLVQIYTGFIYEGPAIVKKINKYLLNNVYN